MENLKTAENQLSAQAKCVVLEENMAERVECDICLKEWKEDELEEHREMCIARLMFRCTICDGDYMSKEGLWNHLDLHGITDESKELHYQEMRATYMLHQCALCNDQRGYQENLYWKHVHEEHDGFFLRCSECSESFRSQKLKTDHNINHCKVREQTTADELEADQKCSNIVLPGQVEHMALSVSCGDTNENNTVQLEPSHSELSYVPGEDHKCFETVVQQDALVPEKILEDDIVYRLSEFTPANSNVADDTVNNVTEKESEVLPIGYSKTRSQTKVDAENIPQPHVENPSDGSPDTKCSYCEKQFPGYIFLASHIELHHKPHTCDICGNTYPTFFKARYHKYMRHMEPKHKCPHCSKLFHRKKNYRKHLSKCESKKYSCKLCHQKFTAAQSVVRHMKLLHHNKGASKKAQIGQKGCKKKQELCQAEKITIKKEITEEEITLIPEKILQPLVQNSSSESSNTMCSLCDKDLFSVVSLARHMEVCHKPHPCNICGIEFSSFIKARYHKMKKHLEAKHNCSHCPMKFHSEKVYQEHVTICVSRKFPCELCGRKFKNRQCVNEHKKRVHSNEVMSKIQTIDSERSFVDSSGRNSTLIQEKGSNIHEEINSSNATEKHLQSLDENPSRKLSDTKCSHCGKEYSSVKSLSYHIVSCHKPTTCNICGELFPGMVAARYHKRKYHMEPKYNCTNCEKKFYQKGIFQAHWSICEGKRFSCEICGQKFKKLANVNVHIKRVHHTEGDMRSIQVDLASCKNQQEQKQAEQMTLKMEITVEETTIVQQDDFGISAPIPSTITDYSDFSQHSTDLKVENSEIPSVDYSEQQSALTQERKSDPRLKGKNDANNDILNNLQTLVENPANGTSESKCPHCGKGFSGNVSLAHHIELSHQSYPCHICGITLCSPRQARYHKMTTHTEPKHKCPHCPRKLYQIRDYQKHLSVCESRNIPCELCGKKFKTLHSVNGHMKRAHHVDLRKAQIDQQGSIQ